MNRHRRKLAWLDRFGNPALRWRDVRRVILLYLCRFPHNEEAVAVFRMDAGCICFPDEQEQALCLHHAMRATPRAGMVVLRDLTRFGTFTEWWEARRRV